VLPVPESPAPRPLDGVRVADFSRVLAGPFCTRMLADLGAEVIKIEPPEGDVSRRLGARRGGMSGYYMQQNCGKRNISVDLKQPRGRELALEVIRHCDVLVENFRPGVMAALGLGPEVVLEERPQLVYCSISGFGASGPAQDQRAFAGIAHASTGMLWRQAAIMGLRTTDSVLALGDTVTGLQAAIAILAALQLSTRTGKGQFIDMAMHDALLSVQEAANFYLFPDEPSETDFLCSWVYRATDRDVVMPTDPRADWESLCRVMGRPDLIHDSRYDTPQKRTACLDELEAHIQSWVLDQPDAEHVVAALHAAGLPGARVSTLGEALDCEQTIVRDMTPTIPDRSGRRVRVLNSPYRFSNATAGVRGVPAFRGEDNESVLRDLLGLSRDDIRRLEDEGVISARVPPRSGSR
jgi:CoA:oxalate CoA-transferase